MYNKVIVFEGIDGSGKSFHLNAASNYLKKKKIKHIKLREPGGSKNSEKLRKLLLSNKSDFEKKTDLLIYLSARSENFHKIIKPNLKKKVILIDRFVDSTKAYQVYGKQISLNFINQIHKYILNGVKPNLTFVLKVSSKTSRKRLLKRRTKNRYDNFSQSFYDKVQKSFLKLAKNKKNYFVLDSSKNDTSLEKEIFKITSKYLKIK